MVRSWRMRIRRGVMWSIVALLLGASTLGVQGADDAAPVIPRVRSTNPAIVAAMTQAQSRSPTFRSLVRTIEATDGIVYVEQGKCGHGVRACLSLSVVSSGGFRWLRVLVGTAEDVVSLIATIGHELCHAIEVLSQPSVRTASDVYLFYVREAATSHDAFETPAAIRTAAAVARELR